MISTCSSAALSRLSWKEEMVTIPPHISTGNRTSAVGAALCVLGLLAWPPAQAQETSPGAPQGTPLAWVQAATGQELNIIQQTGSQTVRYREHKIDARGDTSREVIVSKQGTVARLVERNGKPISAAEDTAERARLQSDLDSPGNFLAHHRHDASNRADEAQMVKLLPQAMVYQFTPGQPQLPGVSGREVVIDYRPNPDFHPPNMLAELLTGIAGRVWIDEATHTMVRIEGHVLKPVNFGFGMVAHIYPGGTLVLEQTQAAAGRWMYSHMEEHVNVRVAMIKTIPENVRITSSDFQVTNTPIGFEDAIRELLAVHIPLQP